MNPSFEEMWNGSNSPENTEVEDNIFASMQPYRVPLSMSSGSDLRMAMAYRKAHAWNVIEATNEMEMISTKTICRKCLLHTKVCRTYGHNLKKYEMDLQLARARVKK
ncbi:uncharacterized protein LOC111596092 [Drosophila hydei]|uniref:Uncharacterized protein LOC111596092 n=1 Tax=Drosophila hydei TaxID=7224 RepID=A0A6J1LFT9_DROHY|nr:uncharacterized protein LOC111596092 [Drosophila hydei]